MNGMKFIKYSALVATAVAVFGEISARAMSVTWASDDTEAITLPGGTTGLPYGDQLELAITSSSAATIQAAWNNGAGGVSAVTALFTVYATGFSGEGTDPSAPGTFLITSVAPGNGFFNQQIYLLAFNNPSATFATEVGVFAGYPYNNQIGSVTGPAGDPWTFPATDTSARFIEANDVQPAGVILGLAGNDTDPADIAWLGPPVSALELAAAPLPEPSSGALVALGLIGAALGRLRLLRRS